MKTDLFQSCGHCWLFQTCWHIECSTFIASSFRIWNSSTGIPSPPLALFFQVVMYGWPVLWPLLSFPNLLAYWVQHFHSIIFQDLKQLNWNSITFTRLWFYQWSCMDVRVGLWRKLNAEELMLLNCGVAEDSWQSLGLQGGPISPSKRRSVLGVHWKDWC